MQSDQEQKKEVVKRSEDPLINWTRPSIDECPVCMLPLPLDGTDAYYCACCGKTMCYGCLYDQAQVDMKEGRLQICYYDLVPVDKKDRKPRIHICPFCRTEAGNTLKQDRKLAKAGHHHAIFRIGWKHFYGQRGLHQNRQEGIKWYSRAAEAGSSHAAFALGSCYLEGDGVENDTDRALEYFQKAADLGGVLAYPAPAFAMIGTFLRERVWWRKVFSI